MAKNLSLIENNGTVYNICDQVARSVAFQNLDNVTALQTTVGKVLRVKAGTTTINAGGQSTATLFTLSDLDTLFGVEGSAKENTLVLAQNAHWEAAHFTTDCVFHNDSSAWVLHMSQGCSIVRVNYLAIRWVEEEEE